MSRDSNRNSNRNSQHLLAGAPKEESVEREIATIETDDLDSGDDFDDEINDETSSNEDYDLEPRTQSEANIRSGINNRSHARYAAYNYKKKSRSKSKRSKSSKV